MLKLIPFCQNIPTILLSNSKKSTKPAEIIHKKKLLQKIAMKIT